jgi:hypothetical protein
MRTPLLVLAGLLMMAGSAAAQTPTLTVLQPTVTNAELGPRSLTPTWLACTDWTTSAMPTSSLRLLASQSGSNNQVFRTGETVVINVGTPVVTPGQRFFVRRYQDGVGGDTQVRYGMAGQTANATERGAIRTAGWLTVVAADQRFALARVDHACDSVMAGDYLDPFIEPTLPATVDPAGQTDFSHLGKVLFGTDRRLTFGDGDVLSIDRGTAQGITPGMRLSFYRDRMNGTPLVELGSGVVLEVLADTAKVVVVRVSDWVQMGDYYGVRK